MYEGPAGAGPDGVDYSERVRSQWRGDKVGALQAIGLFVLGLVGTIISPIVGVVRATTAPDSPTMFLLRVPHEAIQS